MTWTSELVDRLLAGVGPDGGWGYRPATAACAEPTALTCLALAAHGVETRHWANGLGWLADCQRRKGSVPVCAEVAAPGWPTALAALAWICTRPHIGPRYDANVKKATAWLLATGGLRLPLNPAECGHDTTLQGWPWVKNTHSWVEPTAYAILALRAAGQAGHPRVREGVTLLRDRCFPTGGWNYGNTRVLEHTLQPFPATTGIGLCALVGEPVEASIEASIAYLADTVNGVRSPLTIGWGLIGLTAWNARPAPASDWLARCAAERTDGQPTTLHAALLLLAGAETCPLVRVPIGERHG